MNSLVNLSLIREGDQDERRDVLRLGPPSVPTGLCAQGETLRSSAIAAAPEAICSAWPRRPTQ